MTYRLSFCIPTFNFGQYIAETLQSIISQANEHVQIVIVDGGSTDDTAEIVADAMTRFPQIKFIQREKRCGVDLDILESVSQADGEYCWLFSSDDVLAPDAISRALQAIETRNWNVFLMGTKLCDLQMNPMHDHAILACKQCLTFDWSDPKQRSDYFRRAHTSTAFFSFISNIIVYRDQWLSSPTEKQFIGSCWIIAAKIAAMSRIGLRVHYSPDIFLLKRVGNDSFAAQGLIPRIKLSIAGFRFLWAHFYGVNSYEYRQVSRVVLNEYPLIEMLSIKLKLIPNATLQEKKEFYALARFHYNENAWLGAINYLVVRSSPIWLLKISQTAFLFLLAVKHPRKIWP